MSDEEEVREREEEKDAEEEGGEEGGEEEEGGGSSRKRRKKDNGFKPYIVKILKKTHPELSLNSDSVQLVNDMADFLLLQLSGKAALACSYSKSQTLSENALKGAVGPIFGSGELAASVIQQAEQAVERSFSQKEGAAEE